MNISDYLITEFSDNILAFRKPHNELLSSSEVTFIKEQIRPFGQFSLLFSGIHSTLVALMLSKIVDKNYFNSCIENQAEKVFNVDEKNFLLCGYNFDALKDEHTLTFYRKNYESFSDEEMLFFAIEMHKLGATSVYNWHDDISKLNHRLNTRLKCLNYNFIMTPVRRLTCTFKNDVSGCTAVSTLFKKYSVSPVNLENECYEDCVMISFNKEGTFTLLNNSTYLARFSTEELSKICNWLYSLEIKRFEPICYKSDSELLCSTIECSFAPNENWQEKLRSFIKYNEQSYISMLQKLGVILPDATTHSPTWHLESLTKGISFTLFKEANRKEKLSNRERFYFLNQFSIFGATEISTKSDCIYCEFSKDENGRKLRSDAILHLIQ